MPKNACPFGDYLKQLIKAKGMTQTEFYTALGIKKPYFYDILSGRVSPPPPELQFKAMEILNAGDDIKREFFDLAAKERGGIPADISKWVDSDPNAVVKIRKVMNY